MRSEANQGLFFLVNPKGSPEEQHDDGNPQASQHPLPLTLRSGYSPSRRGRKL